MVSQSHCRYNNEMSANKPAITIAEKESAIRRLIRWFCGWPSDVVLWGVLVTIGLVMVAGARVKLLSGELSSFVASTSTGIESLLPQTIVIHSSDANDIKPGSNVYLLGVHIGTVEEVRFPFDRLRDGVAIVVTTHRNIPPLASNMTGYIQFNSLAGAKEIHLVPPPDGQAILGAHPHKGLAGRQLIEMDEPIRLRDVMNVQMETNGYLREGAQTMSRIFGRGGVMNNRLAYLQANIAATQALTAEATDVIGRNTQLLHQYGPEFAEITHNLANKVVGLAEVSTQLERRLNSLNQSQPITRLQTVLMNTDAQLNNIHNRLEPWTERQAAINNWLEQFPPLIRPDTQTNEGVYNPLETTVEQLEKANDALKKANQRFEQTKPPATSK